MGRRLVYRTKRSHFPENISDIERMRFGCAAGAEGADHVFQDGSQKYNTTIMNVDIRSIFPQNIRFGASFSLAH